MPGCRARTAGSRRPLLKLLPLTITPAPVATVRTLVGRVELLTLADEQQLLQTVQTAAASGTVTGDALAAQLGRFAEPKLRRALALSTDAKVQSYVNSVLPTVQALP